MITRHLTQLIVAASLAAGVTGCSSIPEKNAALDAARDDYYAAANDPQVTAQAPLELQEAEQALSQGEQLLLDGGAVEAVEQQAYLARQQVAIAREQARLKSAERVVANAQGERQQVLLAAKTRETDMLKQQLAELQARDTERGLMLTLGDVLFDSGQATLKPGVRRSLDKLASFLRQHPTRRLLIEGFTDSVGGEGYNLQLSEARAAAVRQALLAAGVAPDRIDTRGYGEAYPVASNASSSGRQQNRRVEIVISDEQGRVTPLT